MVKLKKFALSLPAFIITILIFLLSDQPKPELLGIKFDIYDKLLHIIAFFVYGLTLIVFYAANIRSVHYKKIIALVVLTGSIYGLLDEFHQSFVRGRQTEFLDWFADFIGIFLSLIFYKFLKNFVDRLTSI